MIQSTIQPSPSSSLFLLSSPHSSSPHLLLPALLLPTPPSTTPPLLQPPHRFVRHFAEGGTVITPCAIPVNSSREDVKEILASWLEGGEVEAPPPSPGPPPSLSPHRPAEPSSQPSLDR